MRTNDGYYNGLNICSRNAVINIIRITRNTGKTWNFQYRQWRRAIKHHKRAIWLRTFKKEVKEVLKKLYKSADLQKKCGIIPYNKDKNTGNFKQEGNVYYYRRHNNDEWKIFLEVFAVSDANALRSADNVDTDTIIYDECDATTDRQHRYRGNIATDFIDAFISIKREHKVTCFLLCNKESIRNPFFVYFNIPPLPEHYEGIRLYKKGSIAIEQRNIEPKIKNDYDKKVDDLLKGTTYGEYLKGAYKNKVQIKKARAPVDATTYLQLYINGYKLRIACLGATYYVSNTLDTTRRVCVLKTTNKYKYEVLLINRYKKEFIDFINALSDNNIYYDNDVTYEGIQPFYEWLGI